MSITPVQSGRAFLFVLVAKVIVGAAAVLAATALVPAPFVYPTLVLFGGAYWEIVRKEVLWLLTL